MVSHIYQQQAKREWDRARRKAFWAELRADFGGQDRQILNFDQIADRFELSNAFYEGVKRIPLNKIVGSVGRYQDFTDAFLPTTAAMEERWRNIATLYLDATSGGVPPIAAYQVGDTYFVRDGNHRVSVANQLDMVDIEAYIWHYPESVVGLAAGINIDLALLETERQAFLDQTQIDLLRPAHNIRLTAPEGYNTILGQIIYYQYALSQIDGEEISYPDAVTAWYDMRYEVTEQVIEQSGIMKSFPNRTLTDFYIWIIRRHWELY